MKLDARLAPLAFFAVASTVALTWGLPNSDSWGADAISPRSCGLFAIALTYTPGHFHTYPPLHMALLTIASLPFAAIAAARVGLSIDALGVELLKPFYMTGIEIAARLVAIAMGLGIVWNTTRLWERLHGKRAGIVAGWLVATNAILVYYAHTGNLDLPALFWVIWCLVEIDRVASGERRERVALLLAALAVLTKDQVAAALVLVIPLGLVAIPWMTRRARPWRRDLLVGIAVAASTYLLLSGALVNPSGFRARVAFLVGPASTTWAEYPRGLHGTLALALGMVKTIPRFTSWLAAMGAAIGIAIAIARHDDEKERGLTARTLLPFVAALTFTLLFNMSARRADDRFVLLQSVLLLPYAALALEQVWSSWPRASVAIAAIGALAFTRAVLGVASVDGTLLVDPRYEAESYLATLAPGTHVDVYGGPIFLPRIPKELVATRPGTDRIEDRQAIPGVTDIVDVRLDPRGRDPRALVFSSEIPDIASRDGDSPFGLMSYHDEVSRSFFRSVIDGSLGYTRVVRARCTLPWPLECRQIHHSTGGEIWIYAPAAK